MARTGGGEAQVGGQERKWRMDCALHDVYVGGVLPSIGCFMLSHQVQANCTEKQPWLVKP